MNPVLTLIAILQGRPEKRDELLATLREFVKPPRAEQGCVEYHLHVSDEDPTQFIFSENWRSKPTSMFISRRRFWRLSVAGRTFWRSRSTCAK